MKRMTIKAAQAQGYTVDTHTYPHHAYKGPRFCLSEVRQTRPCFTELEAVLLNALDDARAEIVCLHNYYPLAPTRGGDTLQHIEAAFVLAEQAP
jgi:hypothetical protein